MKKFILCLIALVTLFPLSLRAQAQNLADTWQGTLHAGKDLRIVLKISKADDGGYKSAFYSIDQGGQSIPVASTTLQGATVKLSITAIGGTYEGKLNPDGKSIVGSWSQGATPLPLTLERATPETAWTIPEPPKPIPPMAANANPVFDVATIKPSKPDEQRQMISIQGRRLVIVNQTLSDLLSFAYELQPKQIAGAPPWVAADKYDVTAVPDGEGQPSEAQWRSMLEKLLTDRFQLTFHREKKELSVYVLTSAKSGPKLSKSEGDPNGLPGLFFQGPGVLNVRNATMGDFVHMMQSVVLDRPVLDQTGIAGRYNFILKWTPDDSQFHSMGARIPPPSDGAAAPPALFTAIQEQIGLKLEATKAPAEVLVIDRVEKPSAN